MLVSSKNAVSPNGLGRHRHRGVAAAILYVGGKRFEGGGRGQWIIAGGSVDNGDADETQPVFQCKRHIAQTVRFALLKFLENLADLALVLLNLIRLDFVSDYRRLH